jgi:hypothetical protein
MLRARSARTRGQEAREGAFEERHPRGRNALERLLAANIGNRPA